PVKPRGRKRWNRRRRRPRAPPSNRNDLHGGRLARAARFPIDETGETIFVKFRCRTFADKLRTAQRDRSAGSGCEMQTVQSVVAHCPASRRQSVRREYAHCAGCLRQAAIRKDTTMKTTRILNLIAVALVSGLALTTVRAAE